MKKLKKIPAFITLAFLENRLSACRDEAQTVIEQAGTNRIPLDALSIYLLGGAKTPGGAWRVRWFLVHLYHYDYLSGAKYEALRRKYPELFSNSEAIDADAAREIAAVLTAPEKAPKKAKARARTRR